MKKLLTVVLVLFALAAGTGRSVAQQAAEKKPAAGEKSIDKASPKLMTGKVIQVDENKKTFTVVAKGKQHTFLATNFKALPKIGEIIDVTYTETPGGPMEATNLNSSKSNIY